MTTVELHAGEQALEMTTSSDAASSSPSAHKHSAAVVPVQDPSASSASSEAPATAPAPRAKATKAAIARRVLVAAILIAIIVYIIVDNATVKDTQRLLEDFLTWLRNAGALGVFVYIIVYTIATVAFLPGIILTLGGGFAFSAAYGLGEGIAIASFATFTGAFLGSLLAFLIARYLMRDTIVTYALRFPILKAIDRAIQLQGLKIVILLRLNPAIPFNAFNYVTGITSCTFKDYVIGSIGMLPATVIFSYFGSLLSDLKDAAQGATAGDPTVRWAMLVVGVVASIIALVLISFYVRKALRQVLKDDETAAAAAAPAAAAEGAAAAASTGAEAEEDAKQTAVEVTTGEGEATQLKHVSSGYPLLAEGASTPTASGSSDSVTASEGAVEADRV